MVGFYMMQFFSLAMILNNLLSTSIKEANKTRLVWIFPHIPQPF